MTRAVNVGRRLETLPRRERFSIFGITWRMAEALWAGRLTGPAAHAKAVALCRQRNVHPMDVADEIGSALQMAAWDTLITELRSPPRSRHHRAS